MGPEPVMEPCSSTSLGNMPGRCSKGYSKTQTNGRTHFSPLMTRVWRGLYQEVILIIDPGAATAEECKSFSMCCRTVVGVIYLMHREWIAYRYTHSMYSTCMHHLR